jgi:hypothetical protein
MLNIDGTKVGEISGKRGLCLLNITNRKAVIKHVLRLLGLKKKKREEHTVSLEQRLI